MRVVELCVQEAAGRVPVIAGAGSNSTAEAIALTRRHAKGRGRRCGAACHRLLQQAVAGRAVSPFHMAYRRCGGHSDPDLQHSAARDCRHFGRDHGAAFENRQHHRGQGRDRQSHAAYPRAERLRQILAADLGRGRLAPRSAIWPMAAMAVSPSPPMSRPSFAPNSRMPVCAAPSTAPGELQDKLPMPLHDAMFSCEAVARRRPNMPLSLLGHCTPEVRLHAGGTDRWPAAPR